MKKSPEDLPVEQKCTNKKKDTNAEVTNKFRKKGFIFLPRSSTTYILPRGPHLGVEEPLPPHMIKS